jgi:uncharacterized protein (DUF362 family)
MKNSEKKKVILLKQQDPLVDTVREAMTKAGVLDGLSAGSTVALKPNLTYPYYNKGVTTSTEVVRATVEVLKDYTDAISIVESDGGYGAWRAEEAFEGHKLYDLEKEYGVEVTSLHTCATEPVTFRTHGQKHSLPLPIKLLHETDLFITMPVPKIHCMTGLTLAHKNQWGCIPDEMRLRRHYIFNAAIVAINQALKPKVVSDGTFFLDESGPMEGTPVPMDLIIASNDVGAFDRYVSELMGWSWKRVDHLKLAVKKGAMPASLSEIETNIAPADANQHKFKLHRTFRNYIALSGFRSRTITWFGYESWFGRVVLHGILYAIAGKPPEPAPPAEAE